MSTVTYCNANNKAFVSNPSPIQFSDVRNIYKNLIITYRAYENHKVKGGGDSAAWSNIILHAGRLYLGNLTANQVTNASPSHNLGLLV